MDLDVHAVHEHNGIVFLKPAFEPFIYLCAYAFHHAADARLRVVLTIYLVEHIAYLFLREPLGIQHSGQAVALFLLVAEYGKNLRVEVAVAVAGNPELKFSSLPVGPARAIAVTLIPRIISQKLAAFSDHHTLEHDLHQIVETISFCRMLAHQLGKL